MEISKPSLKLIAYLEKFQRFSIPYEEPIKPKELKILLDHMVLIELTLIIVFRLEKTKHTINIYLMISLRVLKKKKIF